MTATWMFCVFLTLLIIATLMPTKTEEIPEDYPDDPPFNAISDLRLFEGDIENVTATNLRNLTSVFSYFMNWSDGRVPYVISPTFFPAEHRIILKGIRQFHKQTCVHFVPRRNEFSYILIQRGNYRCSSHVGRVGGQQPLYLGEGCLHPGIIAHELMHVLGFWHEQSRPDRDEHVVVNWENIIPGMESNFMRFPHGLVDTLNLPYDLGSIMHYGSYAFARSYRRPTLSVRHKSGTGGSTMGQLKKLSKYDVQKINKLYDCSKRRR